MEKITFDECCHARSVVGAFLMKLISDPESKLFQEIFEKSLKDDTRSFNVELKVNGVEVSFTQLVETLWKNYNRDVDNRAYTLVKDKFEKATDLTNFLNKIIDDVKREMLYNVREQLPNLEIYEDDY
jgi:hypothetical protein